MSSDGPSERMRETLKSPYDEDGDVWMALFTAFSAEFAEYEDALEQVETNSFVDTANAGSLERLATIFDIQRRTDEEIPEFRSRLKVELRKRFTSATVPELYEMVATLLGVDQSSFTIEETPRGDTASFLVRFPVDVVGSKNLSTDSLDPLLDDISAAGVNGRGILSTPDADVTVAVPDTVIGEMLTTPPADMPVDVADVLTAPMTEVPEDALQLSAEQSSDELLSFGLSADGLEPLSGDNWSGFEYQIQLSGTAAINALYESVDQTKVSNTGLSSSDLNPLSGDGYTGTRRGSQTSGTTTLTFGADVVTRERIGASEANLGLAVGKATSRNEGEYGLSSGLLSGLSAPGWAGTSSFATELDSDSFALSAESVTSETIGPVTVGASVTAEDVTSSVIQTAGLSSKALGETYFRYDQEITTPDANVRFSGVDAFSVERATQGLSSEGLTAMSEPSNWFSDYQHFESPTGTLSVGGDSSTSETIGPTVGPYRVTAGDSSTRQMSVVDEGSASVTGGGATARVMTAVPEANAAITAESVSAVVRATNTLSSEGLGTLSASQWAVK